MTGPPDEEWFPETEAMPSPMDRSRPVEDWSVEPPLLRPSTFDLWSSADRRILVPAAIAVVFFIAVLAAFGVFESSPHTSAPIISPLTPVAQPATSQPATTTAPRIVPPTIALKPGDIGPQVKALQQELEALGYHVGTIDGSYGPSTTQAVTAFQHTHGLTADGILGPKTLQALAP